MKKWFIWSIAALEYEVLMQVYIERSVAKIVSDMQRSLFI